jgi:hydroxymethylpyrimidine pyrophosphatase-like HAD family hydrolase
MITVGSGGAFTVASFAAYLHEYCTGAISRSETPLTFSRNAVNLRKTAVLIISSSGRNPDVLQAAKSCSSREPGAFFVMCGGPESRLVKTAQLYEEGAAMTFEPPAGSDGFLATNSLVAMSTLFYRLYCGDAPNYDELTCDLVHRNEGQVQEIFERDTVCVLFSESTRCAAIDFESKMSEAALAASLLSDFRSFAHGRHYWLAKRPGTTAVISFESAADRKIADRTIALLPHDVPILRIQSRHNGPMGSLASMLSVFPLVSTFGQNRGVDPGRPGIPLFGRQIYNLRFPNAVFSGDRNLPLLPASRKAALPVWKQIPNRMQVLDEAASSFSARLKRARFSAIVLDYDGTLCSSYRRFSEPEPLIIAEVQRLLAQGLRLGIATGRGRSVGEVLRTLLQEESWSAVLLGYYNGSVIRTLDDDGSLTENIHAEDWCKTAERALMADTSLKAACEIDVRPTQVTVIAKAKRLDENDLWFAVQGAMSRASVTGVKVVSSTHSVDIIHHDTSKAALFPTLRTRYGLVLSSSILSIGDRGSWPGNDAELLANDFSLSVDEVSADIGSCWNLAPAGMKGTRALLYYLKHLKSGRNGFRMDLTGGNRER